ncbi:cytochrome P450 [Cylindrobasidium torrendii FP15055 ss-10]|uniref:Cytochrome P450 n=1 Tax=Cylindrobasidium torrendii FP15055 ss-10 TaxID=1314674 RepID=A0A0D7BGY5_9AGAR|nr:cytochrome P450 [Cylindrobasidium torrendii FP15055 ss-10]
MTSTSTSSTLLATFVGAAVLYAWLTRRAHGKLPPGPPGLPIIGNMLDMAHGRVWENFARMGETYGPVISLTIGATPIIVINTFEQAKQIFDAKGAIYSSRPSLFMSGELMGWKKSCGFLESGKDLIQTRRMIHQELGSMSQIRTFYPQEEDQARRFLGLVAEKPDRIVDHCFRHAGAIILRITYGYTAKDYDDEVITAVNKAMHTLVVATHPGLRGFLVDQFPILASLPEWVPGTHFKRLGREWAALYENMLDLPLNYTRQCLKDGTAENSFSAKWLRRGLPKDEEELLRHAAGSLEAAGAETTAVALHAFYLLMAIHPDVLKRAQAEVDEVCGHDRLPTYADREHLPYLQAVLKELARFHLSVPLAIPHTTTQDDIHDGYCIPKGSMIFSNLWAMARDSEMYPNPHKFDPDRFLGNTPNRDPYDFVFGIGRRRCPGRLLADASVFITSAMTLATFNIKPGKNASGERVVPCLEPGPDMVCLPKHFPLEITPRFSQEQMDVLIRGAH